MQFKLKYLLLLLTVAISINSTAQKSKRQVLEARRVQLQKDQIYINALLSNTIRTEKNVLNQLNDLKAKINTRQELIKAIENESKELSNEIYTNQLKINKNKRDLEALKKGYGEMIYSSYKSKSQNSRIMFLLSSENFFQGYKRFQYMKQYTAFRKKQGDEIHKKTSELEALTDSLQVKKDQKKALLDIQKKEHAVIEKEKKEQETLLAKVKQKENTYKKQIKQFQKEESRVASQIDKLIRAAIAASNKKSGSTTTTSTTSKSSTSFALTPAAKELNSKFELNKGKLDWPVEKGYVSTFYGKQPHPIVKSTTIQSNGVRITTEAGSKARAVFDGTVLAVQVTSGNKKAVLIQHGNYITVYKNLENTNLKTGDAVKTKQEIGTIFTDKVTGKTILGFEFWNNTHKENPRPWIYKM